MKGPVYKKLEKYLPKNRLKEIKTKPSEEKVIFTGFSSSVKEINEVLKNK